MPSVFQPFVRFHRNGLSGESFHTVSFFDHRQNKRARRLRAVVFETPGCVAIVDSDNAGTRFDGPYYEAELRAAIEAAANNPLTYDRTA